MQALAQQLSNSTILSPAEYEAQKTRQQRAEDFIYTLNHAVTCLSLTDFLIAPFFASTFGWNICGHDHGKDGHSHTNGGSSGSSGHVHTASCNHEPLKLAPTTPTPPAADGSARLKPVSGTAEEGLAKLKKLGLPVPPGDVPPSPIGPPKPPQVEPPKPSTAYYSLTPAEKPAAEGWLAKLKTKLPVMKEWFIGEFVGDAGAVPFTLAVQRFAPGVMSGIQRVAEPVVGGLLKRRATAAAEKWADANGKTGDAEAIVNHAQHLYDYEMRHLPQMVMWTVASSVINYGVMKYRNPALEFGTFTKGKVAGAAITAGLVFGTRTLAPEAAHQWDSTMGRNVVVPITKKVGKIFGVKEHEVDRFHAREEGRDAAPKRWAERVQPDAIQENRAL